MLGEICRGLWLTLKHSFKKRVTVQYPEVKEEMPVGYPRPPQAAALGGRPGALRGV